MISPLAALLRLHEIETEENQTASNEDNPERLIQAIEPRAMMKYRKMRNRYGTRAVVPVERGVCTGCHMRQPNMVQELDEEISECQNCGRLLYEPDAAYEHYVG
jgi:predicted  nucleic acid-binding Zn-ribbon protein